MSLSLFELSRNWCRGFSLRKFWFKNILKISPVVRKLNPSNIFLPRLGQQNQWWNLICMWSWQKIQIHFEYLFTSTNICLLKLDWTTEHEVKGWSGRRLNINVSAAYLYWHKHHAIQYKLQVQRKKCTRNVILGSRDIRSYPPPAAETHIYTGGG